MEQSKKNLIKSITIFAVFFCLAFFGTKLIFGGSAVASELKQVAKDLNKTCPTMVDSETQLNKAEADGETLKYDFTLVNVTADAPDFNKDDAMEFIKKNAQQNLDTAPQMEHFRNQGVELKYSYKDKNGKFLFYFAITPKKK